MAITTRAGVRSGLQWARPFAKRTAGNGQSSKWSTFWSGTGNPSAGAYDTTLAGVTCSSSTAGAFPFTNPASGLTYFAGLNGTFSSPNWTGGHLLLVDRLWHNGGFTITSTTAQTVSSATFPARDSSGSTNGRDVMLALEVSAACGAAAPTITINYTNDAGTASRTATNYLATANSPAIATVYPIGLQAGDRGVRSVQSLTLSVSWISGTINLVAYRLIGVATLPAHSAGPFAVDDIQGGFQKIYDDSCLYFISTGGSANVASAMGSIMWAQG